MATAAPVAICQPVDASPEEVVHAGVHCDVFRVKPLAGIRFKCPNCADFDMCYKCATTSNVHLPKHIFIEVRNAALTFRAIKPRPCVAVDVQRMILAPILSQMIEEVEEAEKVRVLNERVERISAC